jgi:hypothetical protein
MPDDPVHIAGELEHWPDKQSMAYILRGAGIRVAVGRYSLRVQDCSRFVFQHYGGDLGPPVIDADADSLDEMLRDAGLVSRALARAGVRHRFEMYNASNELLGYLHFERPLY